MQKTRRYLTGSNELYLEAEKRIWKMKNILIRSVALNVLLIGFIILIEYFRYGG